MRTCSLTLLLFLLLPLLISGAHGSRLGKFGRKSNEARVLCQDEDHCASRGKNRKLTATTTSSTSMAKAVQEKEENGAKKVEVTRGKRENGINTSPSSANKSSSAAAASPATSRDDVGQQNKGLDLIDMTEMDYSPATRKSPIHN